MEPTRKSFIRRVSRLFWSACSLDDQDNSDLSLAMFYLGYTELSVQRACSMSKDDPVRAKYIHIAESMGMDKLIDSIEVM